MCLKFTNWIYYFGLLIYLLKEEMNQSDEDYCDQYIKEEMNQSDEDYCDQYIKEAIEIGAYAGERRSKFAVFILFIFF